jgi:uncharacterized protein YbjT (DUF2867 family)
MYVILGATGHVGSATANALIEQGEAVTIVTRNAERGDVWAKRGATMAIADVRSPDHLRAVLRTGRRAFLLNPPASPDTDTDAVERGTVANILEALQGSGLEKVVALSTYGAQPGECLGDLNTLHDLETGLAAQPIPFTIMRAAYYFTNWDVFLEPVRESGVLPSMYPADLRLPMVSPDDLGRVAARLLTDTASLSGPVHVEGPQRYSPADVAEAFARALQRPVEVAVTPRDGWEEAYRKMGFSKAAARSYARMTAITADRDYDNLVDPVRGAISLQDHVARLVGRSLG